MILNFKTKKKFDFTFKYKKKKVATFRLKYTKIKILPIFKTRVHQELISAYFSKYWNPADYISHYQIKIRLYSKSVTSFKLSLEQAEKMKKSWRTEKSRNG